MPSTSPGQVDLDTPTTTTFSHIFPGAPAGSLHAFATFVYRFRRYIAYISGKQLNVLSCPNTLVQAVTFQQDLVAVAADAKSGKLTVASKEQIWVLEPLTEGWSKIWWEKALLLRRDDEEGEDHVRSVSWSSEGEALVGGDKTLTLFSTLPSSRTSSPRTSAIDGETIEDRRPLWSKPVAAPIRQAVFSPSSTLIASCAIYGRLVKIWRRLSFEEGLFDHTYLPHSAPLTHVQWRPLDDSAEARRGSSISRRHEDEPEVLYTIASDAVLRVWRTGSMHDLDILVLYTSVDLVAAIPESPSLSAGGRSSNVPPSRYAVILPSEQFSAALSAAIGLPTGGKVSHSKELLKELISKDFDVIIALDGQGRMSAWGLQSIGHKRRPDTPTTAQPFHITHAEDLQLRVPRDTPALSTAWFEDDRFHLLAHRFANQGDISWWQGSVETFFSPAAPGLERLSRACSWLGKTLPDWSGTNGQPRRIGTTSSTDSTNDDDVLHKILVPPKTGGKKQFTLTISKSGRVSAAGETSASTNALQSEFDSGVAEPPIVAASSEIAALVAKDLRSLTIVDIVGGYVEQEQKLASDVLHVECHTLGARQNFVAVGHRTNVEVFAQGRYELKRQTWKSIRRISLSGMGVTITGLSWKYDGSLAIEAGDSLLIASPNVQNARLDFHDQQFADDSRKETNGMGLCELALLLQQPLPVWHPSVLESLVYYGYASLAASFLTKLAYKLKFWGSGEELDPLLGENFTQLTLEASGTITTLDTDTVNDLKEQLNEKRLPSLSQEDQSSLGRVIDAIAYLRDHIRGLDSNALRYLFVWKLQLVNHQDRHSELNGALNGAPQTNGFHHAESFVPEMSWREISFAYHSTTQQPLLDLLILHHDNKLTWNDARRLGITSWLSDREALVQVFEQLAQTAYRSEQPPDPVNAAIYYLALHKKQTLVALWRIATWHKEQRTTMNFLKKDFSQLDAQTAAKKNAYALMGKRRFHYAAAFFLLADDPSSACNVLAGQCEDVHFAIAVARLYCGDGAPVLVKLLTDRLLPEAEEQGNRWLTSWCRSILWENEGSTESLVEPQDGVRKWHQDDPATLLLYRQLRKGPSKHEYAAVLRSARLLRRMGLSLLALDLVSTWRFTPMAPRTDTVDGVNHRVTNGFHTNLPTRNAEPESPAAQLIEPPSLLDDFTRPIPESSTSKDDQQSREAKAAALLAKIKAKKEGSTSTAPNISENTKKPEPTQFKEPDANSLLDSFGF